MIDLHNSDELKRRLFLPVMGFMGVATTENSDVVLEAQF